MVTRPRQNSSALAKRLRNLGAQVIEMPSIHTVAIDPNERLKKALGEIQHSEKEEWFVFTSPIGVHVFFEQLEKEAWDMRRLLAGKAQIKNRGHRFCDGGCIKKNTDCLQISCRRFIMQESWEKHLQKIFQSIVRLRSFGQRKDL